ncbi:MAG: hypothetical protein JKY20_09370, partial [Alphaproteobacteria bacterium]|nr:hypothetical protein [Alphaproteobacteria bacterium]
MIAVVGAAFVIAVVVAGVSVMTGASTQGALAIAAVVTLGGIGAAMVLRTALRQRDDVRQNHIWLSSTLDQAGMMAFAEDAAGTPVFSSRPSHTGKRMSI